MQAFKRSQAFQKGNISLNPGVKAEWQRALPTAKQTLQRSDIVQLGSTGEVHRQVILKTPQEADQVMRF